MWNSLKEIEKDFYILNNPNCNLDSIHTIQNKIIDSSQAKAIMLINPGRPIKDFGHDLDDYFIDTSFNTRQCRMAAANAGYFEALEIILEKSECSKMIYSSLSNNGLINQEIDDILKKEYQEYSKLIRQKYDKGFKYIFSGLKQLQFNNLLSEKDLALILALTEKKVKRNVGQEYFEKLSNDISPINEMTDKLYLLMERIVRSGDSNAQDHYDELMSRMKIQDTKFYHPKSRIISAMIDAYHEEKFHIYNDMKDVKEVVSKIQALGVNQFLVTSHPNKKKQWTKIRRCIDGVFDTGRTHIVNGNKHIFIKELAKHLNIDLCTLAYGGDRISDMSIKKNNSIAIRKITSNASRVQDKYNNIEQVPHYFTNSIFMLPRIIEYNNLTYNNK